MPRGYRCQAGARPAGVSLLGLAVVLAIAAAAAVGLFVRWNQRQAESRDESRRVALAAVATAQESHFDRTRRYAALEELVAQKLLAELPRDPKSGRVYELYRTTKADEWCAFAKLEASVDPYLTHDEYRARTTNQLPTNLATCKN